jgi:hypothetical protein
MLIFIYILIAAAVAFLIYSIVLTVNLFKCFGLDAADPEQNKKRLIKYRNRMILSYIAAVLLITAAAAVKIIFVI